MDPWLYARAKLHRIAFDFGRLPALDFSPGIGISLLHMPNQPGVLLADCLLPPRSVPELQDFDREAVHQFAGVKKTGGAAPGEFLPGSMPLDRFGQARGIQSPVLDLLEGRVGLHQMQAGR